MPIITDSALPVFKSSGKVSEASPAIFTTAMAKVAPKSSNTIETVVDVGMPRELKMSSKIMSVTITAIKMHMSS